MCAMTISDGVNFSTKIQDLPQPELNQTLLRVLIITRSPEMNGIQLVLVLIVKVALSYTWVRTYTCKTF